MALTIDGLRTMFHTGERARWAIIAGWLVVDVYGLPVAEILDGLALLRGQIEDADSDEMKTVPVSLSESEHLRLKVLAAQSNTTMGGLIRRCLYAAGILKTIGHGTTADS